MANNAPTILGNDALATPSHQVINVEVITGDATSAIPGDDALLNLRFEGSPEIFLRGHHETTRLVRGL